MGLSNYLPSSRLIQPGVIANSGERPASPYEGMVVFQKDTNQTLVWDGSSWVMVHDTDQPPGLQLIRSVSFSNSTAVNVDGVFSSDFRNYKIIVGMRPISTQTGDAVIQLRSSGSNISAINYVWQGYNQNASNAPIANNGAQSGGWYLTNYYSATDYSAFTELTLFSPNETAFTGYQATTSFDWIGPTYYSRTMHGFYPATTVADGFRIVPNPACNGYIRVYGYRD